MTNPVSPAGARRSAPARPLPLALALAAAWPVLATAQALPADATLRETVVTATRVEQPIADLVGDVSIVDRATIERSGATGVADVLARLPGIEIAPDQGAAHRHRCLEALARC